MTKKIYRGCPGKDPDTRAHINTSEGEFDQLDCLVVDYSKQDEEDYRRGIKDWQDVEDALKNAGMPESERKVKNPFPNLPEPGTWDIADTKGIKHGPGVSLERYSEHLERILGNDPKEDAKNERADKFRTVCAPNGRSKGQEARTKNAENMAAFVVSKAERLAREGTPRRNIAGIVAKNLNISPRRVRQILKEKRK